MMPISTFNLHSAYGAGVVMMHHSLLGVVLILPTYGGDTAVKTAGFSAVLMYCDTRKDLDTAYHAQ